MSGGAEPAARAARRPSRRAVLATVGLAGAAGAAWAVNVRFGHPVEHVAHWWLAARRVPAPDAVRVVVLGDSSALGIGAARPGESLAGRISRHVEARTSRDVHVTNLAAGGARVPDVETRQLPHADLHEEDLIVVSIGSADAAQGRPLPEFEHDLAGLLGALPPDRTALSDVAAVPGSEPYQEVLADLADDRGIRRAEFVAAFEAAGRLDVVAPDGLHLNSRGHGIWFDAFRPVIDEILAGP